MPIVPFVRDGGSGGSDGGALLACGRALRRPFFFVDGVEVFCEAPRLGRNQRERLERRRVQGHGQDGRTRLALLRRRLRTLLLLWGDGPGSRRSLFRRTLCPGAR